MCEAGGLVGARHAVGLRLVFLFSHTRGINRRENELLRGISVAEASADAGPCRSVMSSVFASP